MSKSASVEYPKIPDLKTELPGPRAKKIIEADEQFISPSYTRDYPLVIERGRGAVVEDVDGNVFLDLTAGIAVTSTGHSHPAVVEAIREQAGRFLHMSGTDFYYEGMPELAAKLAAVAPGKDAKRVFFANSGAECTEGAMKLARYATGRKDFIAFQGCFHGRTYGAMSLTSSKAVQRQNFGPFLAGVFHAPYANPYRCRLGSTAETTSDNCLDYLENTILKTVTSPDQVAAIIVEPIQGEGGYVVPPAEFLQGLQRICRDNGILLVADEVQSGMGRTGKWWASEHFGIEPDIITSAKGIASGLPLGAIIARADIMQWRPGAHASTFGGNPVSIAAALATFKVIEDGALENARTVGDYIMQKLADWPDRHPLVGDVRGKGLMIGVELVRDKQTRERAIEERNAVVHAAFRRGLLMLGAGQNTIRFASPLVITKEQADIALGILDESLTEIESK